MPQLNRNTVAPKLWFGTEESFDAVVQAVEQLSVLEAAGPEALKAAVLSRGGGRGDDPFELPPMSNVNDGTAVMSINGSLVSGHSGFMRLFGVTGYADIQDELLRLAADKGVKAILLAIDSGGGHVNGVEDTGNMIQMIDRIKPVVAYTDGDMQSAAYWLGTSAREVYGAKTSQIGSVGTLVVHTEYSEALKEAGVKKTILKHGKFKAAANPYEPLTDEGKEQIQAIVNESGKIFVDYVSDRRGVSAVEFQKKMGEGRVFIGRMAHEAGLTDGVKSFQEVMAHMKVLDKPNTAQQNPRNLGRNPTMKATFSKKTLLAIAAGTVIDALGLDTPEANLEGVKLEGEALALFKAEATELKAAFDAEVLVKTTAAVTSATAEGATKLATESAKVADLTAQLAAMTGKVVVAEAATVQLTGQISASTALAAKQSEIVKASCSVMSVALGGKADIAAALVGDALLAEHERLKVAFEQKFPKGGVAAVTSLPKTEAAAAAPNQQFINLVKSRTAA